MTNRLRRPKKRDLRTVIASLASLEEVKGYREGVAFLKREMTPEESTALAERERELIRKQAR